MFKNSGDPLTANLPIVTRFRKLPESSRALIRSFGSFYVALPLIGTFTSAFLWEHVTSRLAVPVFFCGMYPGLTVGFFASIFCLRLISIQQLYAIGLVAQIFPAFYLSLVHVSKLEEIATAGFIFGIIGGFYWAARNFLTLLLTHEAHRDYFFGVDSFLSVTSSTIFPILFGFLIEYGFFLGGSIDTRDSFKFLIIAIFVVLILGARGILRASLGSMPAKRMRLPDASPQWNSTRMLLAFFGAGMGGVSFIPPLLILSQFNGQAQLGGLQSLAALLSAAALYHLGKTITAPKHRFVGLLGAILFLFLCSVPLQFGLYDWNVFVLTTATGFIFPFLWNCINAAILSSIEFNDPNRENSFGYFCDREACLNFGRLVGALACIGIATVYSMELSLRVMPLIATAFFTLSSWQLLRVNKAICSKAS